MEQVFGPVTGFTLTLLVTLLTQWVKSNLNLSPKQVQFVALGFSLVFIGTFQALTNPIDPLQIFFAIVYSFFGWFTAIGMYEVATKQLQK